MKAGDEVVVSPTELIAGGEALARVGTLPIFCANLYPGDVAVVRITEMKRGFGRADLVRLIEPSRWRRTEPCPIAGECGGCDWAALRLDRQLEAKRRILTESLRRIGKFDPASLPPITIHPSPLNYRIRSRLHRDGEAVGFYALRSNRVVPLANECEVVGPQTRLHPMADETWEIEGQLITGDHELTIRVDQTVYRLSPRSFFQVNRHLLSTLLRLVGDHASRVRNRSLAVDLYAGVGFFAVPLAALFEQVLAVEGSAESARYGRLNAPANVTFIEAPVERQPIPPAPFIFLDPPRAGARKEVIAEVSRRATEMVCYLSCDPVTFSRDANRLIASGWHLSTLDLLDLFPNTHHVETLSSFERAR